MSIVLCKDELKSMKVRQGLGVGGNKSELWDHKLWGDSGRRDKEKTKKEPLKGRESWKAWRCGRQGKEKFKVGSI